MVSTKPPSTPSTEAKKGRFRGWLGGIARQQREMAYPAHVAELNRDVFRAYKGIFSPSVTPKRVDLFADAVARQGLSEEFLANQLERLKNLQIVMYCMGVVILVYSVWLAATSSLFFGFGAAIWGFGIVIRGYIYAYRAWQIQNRDLIRLQDALLIKSTYLVL